MISTAELTLSCHVDDHVPHAGSKGFTALGSAPYAVVGTWCECHMAGSSRDGELRASNSTTGLGDGLWGWLLFWT